MPKRWKSRNGCNAFGKTWRDIGDFAVDFATQPLDTARHFAKNDIVHARSCHKSSARCAKERTSSKLAGFSPQEGRKTSLTVRKKRHHRANRLSRARIGLQSRSFFRCESFFYREQALSGIDELLILLGCQFLKPMKGLFFVHAGELHQQALRLLDNFAIGKCLP